MIPLDLQIVTDQDAEPVDHDDALVEFLIRFVQCSTSGETSAAERSVSLFTEERKA